MNMSKTLTSIALVLLLTACAGNQVSQGNPRNLDCADDKVTALNQYFNVADSAVHCKVAYINRFWG